MDLQSISQLISTMGFPIVACIYLAMSNDKLRTTFEENTFWWNINLKDVEENTKTIASLEKVVSMYFLKEGKTNGGE